MLTTRVHVQVHQPHWLFPWAGTPIQVMQYSCLLACFQMQPQPVCSSSPNRMPATRSACPVPTPFRYPARTSCDASNQCAPEAKYAKRYRGDHTLVQQHGSDRQKAVLMPIHAHPCTVLKHCKPYPSQLLTIIPCPARLTPNSHTRASIMHTHRTRTSRV